MNIKDAISLLQDEIDISKNRRAKEGSNYTNWADHFKVAALRIAIDYLKTVKIDSYKPASGEPIVLSATQMVPFGEDISKGFEKARDKLLDEVSKHIKYSDLGNLDNPFHVCVACRLTVVPE